MGFLTTLIYIILGYYALKWILKILSPYILKFAVKRFDKKMGVDLGDLNSNSNNKPPHKSNPTNPSKSKVGDYIDYEEIE